MKKLVSNLLLLALMGLLIVSCGQANEKKTGETKKANAVEKSMESGKVIVFYFHSKQRCKTCLTIQEVAATTIKENYADNGDVIFEEVDYSDTANEKLADKYEIAMSSLIIAKGEEYENLTELAFANALRNPDALKTAINETIITFLNK